MPRDEVLLLDMLIGARHVPNAENSPKDNRSCQPTAP